MVGYHYFYIPPLWVVRWLIDDFGNSVDLVDLRDARTYDRAIDFVESDGEI